MGFRLLKQIQKIKGPLNLPLWCMQQMIMMACLRYKALLLQAVIVFMAVEWVPYTLFSDTYEYPDWGMGIGWAITAFCLAPIPAFFLLNCVRRRGYKVSFQTEIFKRPGLMAD